ncbi:hypothetical protein D0Y65_015314 [Glycine soja]|uniref:Kinesin motor domain-containing protein n=1 Tax=Glycine soja TaxID=3848 RepID=A0A445KCU7_GLYSO|nr:hypothetical protein D0Y65_015314 [Glycine soja]
MALLQQGNQNRTTESTRANETSSRSHAILQVQRELLPRIKEQLDLLRVPISTNCNELKSRSYRFRSPVQTAKKRAFGT